MVGCHKNPRSPGSGKRTDCREVWLASNFPSGEGRVGATRDEARDGPARASCGGPSGYPEPRHGWLTSWIPAAPPPATLLEGPRFPLPLVVTAVPFRWRVPTSRGPWHCCRYSRERFPRHRDHLLDTRTRHGPLGFRFFRLPTRYSPREYPLQNPAGGDRGALAKWRVPWLGGP
jgi:hypothetical protein